MKFQCYFRLLDSFWKFTSSSRTLPGFFCTRSSDHRCSGHVQVIDLSVRFSPCFLFQLGLSAFWGIIILLSVFLLKLFFFFFFFCFHAILEMNFFYPFKMWVPHNPKAVYFHHHAKVVLKCNVLSNWVQFSSTIQYCWYFMVLRAQF